MAVADILKRIEDDAAAEAAAIVQAAEKRATETLGAAQARAAEHRESTLADAAASADREASRVVVAAKLGARDEALARKRELVDEALAGTARQLAALPDADYAAFLAARIAAVARGGETVRLGSADLARRDAIAAALTALAPGTQIVADPAPFERGALVEGSRVRADLSLSAIVEERRDDLELVVAGVLFGTEE